VVVDYSSFFPDVVFFPCFIIFFLSVVVDYSSFFQCVWHFSPPLSSGNQRAAAVKAHRWSLLCILNYLF